MVVAVAAGVLPGRQLAPSEEQGQQLTPPQGGMAASLDEDLAAPEVWAASEEGDLLPAGGTAAGPAPLPAASQVPSVFTRIPKPAISGPRHVGIQAGHWQTEAAPPELYRLWAATGTSAAGVNEVDVNLDVARRIAAILGAQGIVVDVLPTTIPPGYVADAFVALHADGDGTGENSGFKLAYASRRTPYEADLLESIRGDYAAATQLAYDPTHVSRAMRSYYALSWQRVKWSTAPHTPSVILEMGYMSNRGDREVLTDRADVVAGAIASGILKFLDTHPRNELFGEDLLVPAQPQLRRPAA